MPTSEDYTPSTDEVRIRFQRDIARNRADDYPDPRVSEAEFNRWLAARDADHEKAVRERIARDIEAEAVVVDEHGNHGLWVEDAVRIARGGCMTETACPYYAVMGRHLYVGHRNNVCCLGCGIEQREGA
jgi:hypothetical protein